MDSLKMRDALDPISYQKNLEELSSYLPLYKKVDYALLTKSHEFFFHRFRAFQVRLIRNQLDNIVCLSYETLGYI